VADPTSLGVLGFSYLYSNPDQLQAVRVDGVAPSRDSIEAWRYPLSRPLFLYVNAARLHATPGLAEFLREFLADRASGADGYLVSRGLMPLPAAELRSERAKLERALARRD
jgi:phosphate transport system substrate-binding protein